MISLELLVPGSQHLRGDSTDQVPRLSGGSREASLGPAQRPAAGGAAWNRGPAAQLRLPGRDGSRIAGHRRAQASFDTIRLLIEE